MRAGESSPTRPTDRRHGGGIVERCFNLLKEGRDIAMRSDKLARNYRAAISLAAALIWIKTDLVSSR